MNKADLLKLRAAEMARIAADTVFTIGEMLPREDIKIRSEAIYGELVDLESALRAK